MPREVMAHAIPEDGTSLRQNQDKEFAGHIIGLEIANGTRKANAHTITESYRLKLPKAIPSPRVEDPRVDVLHTIGVSVICILNLFDVVNIIPCTLRCLLWVMDAIWSMSYSLLCLGTAFYSYPFVC